MKTKNENAKWIILTIMFVMIVTGIFAQKVSDNSKLQKSHQEIASPPSSLPSPPSPPPPPPSQIMGDSMEDAPPPPFALPDFTDEQKEKIKKSDLKQMEAMTPLRNQMREKKVRLMTMLTTMPMNQKDADQVADEIGKLEAAILKQQIRHDQELRAILTPEQQIIFDTRPKPFLLKRNPAHKGGAQKNY